MIRGVSSFGNLHFLPRTPPSLLSFAYSSFPPNIINLLNVVLTREEVLLLLLQMNKKKKNIKNTTRQLIAQSIETCPIVLPSKQFKGGAHRRHETSQHGSQIEKKKRSIL
uniref:F-box domain-containing protein n=1 Tax=Caenorhabditis tropicalis TaxID=1561998 RepID=A0A1I7T6C3_9PELO